MTVKNRLINAPLGPLFLSVTVPIIIGLLVNGLYSFIDAIFITRAVGTEAIGGVTAAFPLQMLMISISSMLGSGMASIISRKLGDGQDKEASVIFSSSLFLSAAVGLVLSLVLMVSSRGIFESFNLPPNLLPYSMEYVLPILGLSVISFSYGCLSEAFRAEGDTRLVMKLMALQSGLNIILDALFLFVFEWGVAGAAWATVIAVCVTLLYAVKCLQRSNHRVKFLPDSFQFNPDVNKQVLVIGFPIFLSHSGFALMIATVNVLVIRVGGANADLLISAYGILNRSFMLIFLPVLGMMIGFQTLIGFNFGAKQYGRVNSIFKVAVLSCTIYACVCSLLMLTEPEWLYQLFTQDQALIASAAEISRITYIGFIFIGIGMLCPAMFQAIGHAKPAMMLNLIRTYLLLIPSLWLGAALFGVKGVWWVFPIVDLTSAIILGVYTIGYLIRLKRRDSVQLAEVLD